MPGGSGKPKGQSGQCSHGSGKPPLQRFQAANSLATQLEALRSRKHPKKKKKQSKTKQRSKHRRKKANTKPNLIELNISKYILIYFDIFLI